MKTLNTEIVKYVILSLWWLRYLWELLLNILQYITCKTTDVPVELARVTNRSNFEKLRSHKLAELTKDFLYGIVWIALYTTIILAGLVAKTWAFVEYIIPDKRELPVSCLWIFLVVTAFALIIIPSNVCSYILDIKYSDSKERVCSCMEEKLLLYVGEASWKLIFVAALVPLFHWIGDWVFLILWIINQLVCLLLLGVWSGFVNLASSVDLPSLPDGQLKTEIERVANYLEFPLTKIITFESYEEKAYDSSGHYIVCADKVVAMDNTLFGAGCQNDEIAALVAHQLGHWKYHHSDLIRSKYTIFKEIQLNISYLILYLLINRPEIYQIVGFTPGVQPLVPGMWTIVEIVLSIYSFFTKGFEQYILRRMEYRADELCIQIRKGEALKRALVKLYRDDLEFPVDNKLYSFWYYHFPTLLERIKGLS